MPLPILLAAALLAQAAPPTAPRVAAATEPPTDVQLRNSPHWLQLPTPAEIRAAAPRGPGRGEATLSCILNDDGQLTGCRVASESPAAAGFGAAALSLASKFRMSPLTAKGDSVGGAEVEVPIVFRPRGRR
jgi:periplasmic protein TonB